MLVWESACATDTDVSAEVSAAVSSASATISATSSTLRWMRPATVGDRAGGRRCGGLSIDRVPVGARGAVGSHRRFPTLGDAADRSARERP